MASFNIWNNGKFDLTSRFSEWEQQHDQQVRGSEYWTSLVRNIETDEAHVLLDRLMQDGRRSPQIQPGSRTPRVFISHRQSDIAPALRIAYLANQSGFEYWLDILDPALQDASAQFNNLSDSMQAIVIAAIIEMALLNCTHVIAVMSRKTSGSQWVPYEFGRVKEHKIESDRSACWLHPSFSGKAPAEYLYLGKQHVSDREVEMWFKSQMTKYGSASSQAAETWAGNVPPRLP